MRKLKASTRRNTASNDNDDEQGIPGNRSHTEQQHTAPFSTLLSQRYGRQSYSKKAAILSARSQPRRDAASNTLKEWRLNFSPSVRLFLFQGSPHKGEESQT